ncbi:MAG: glycosyltransferase family 2 protein [Candidatus Shapirobacteria bacterium]|nr:glycosyltransferase family 2 protein [Candidatus Shapirobacteria bacterium]MDD3003100.1 glycosyltransferase family 2 protein [Candidatus Shapirobacteria bacterium]
MIVSFIIPTLNAASVLETCLKSIKKQNLKNYEIIIADGGSTDNTLKIAKKYQAKILKNPLKTAEAGKAVGFKQAIGKYIALIDSDNILPTKNWLQKNIDILEKDSSLIGTEPIRFTYRPKAGFIERYSALIGVNDPYAFISGVYDRQNFINFKWTGLKIDQIDKNQYIKITLKPNSAIPTIGANGTIFRSDFLKNNLKSDYLFDIDILADYLNKNKKPIYFAKVKQGIIHTFCESSIKKFIRKQNRRITDYFNYQNLRQFNWNQTNKYGILKFILYTVLIIPVLFDTIRGFYNKPDSAWFFHPLACFITLYLYTINTIKKRLNLLKQLDRKQWQQ